MADINNSTNNITVAGDSSNHNNNIYNTGNNVTIYGGSKGWSGGWD